MKYLSLRSRSGVVDIPNCGNPEIIDTSTIINTLCRLFLYTYVFIYTYVTIMLMKKGAMSLRGKFWKWKHCESGPGGKGGRKVEGERDINIF